MRKLIIDLKLNQVGVLEMLIALYPIMAAYTYGKFRLAIFILLLIDVFLLCRRRLRILNYKPLLFFSVFFVLHQLIWILFFDVKQTSFINSSLGAMLFLASIYIITPNLNFNKLIGCINWVAIFALIGLLYHYILCLRGMEFTPIKVPFLPTPTGEESRVTDLLSRPVSFFMEPQSYISFMLFPMFYAIISKKYIWFAIIAVSFILSTSTTGLAMIPTMVIIYVIMGKSKIIYKILIAIIFVALVFFLIKSRYAETGLEKVERTEFDANARTINGPALAGTMDLSSVFFGVPYANANDYYYSQPTATTLVVPDSRGNIFVSAFWNAFVFFGFIGLILFMAVYLGFLSHKKSILPLVGCFIVESFSNSDFLSAAWTFQIMYLITYCLNNNTDESSYSNYAVCK